MKTLKWHVIGSGWDENGDKNGLYGREFKGRYYRKNHREYSMIRNVEENVSGIREGNWQRNMAGNTVLPEIVAPLAGLVLHCLLMTPTGDHKARTVAAAAAVATTVPLPLPQ